MIFCESLQQRALAFHNCYYSLIFVYSRNISRKSVSAMELYQKRCFPMWCLLAILNLFRSNHFSRP